MGIAFILVRKKEGGVIVEISRGVILKFEIVLNERRFDLKYAKKYLIPLTIYNIIYFGYI